MPEKSVGTIAWQTHSRGSVADEAVHPFHYQVRNTSLSYLLQQQCWYNHVKGPRHVKQLQCYHAVFVLPCCADLLNQKGNSSVYGLAGVGPLVLSRAVAMLPRHGQNLPCFDTF